MVIFFLMILPQLWGADLLWSWRGWAIAAVGMLFGTWLVLRFGTRRGGSGGVADGAGPASLSTIFPGSGPAATVRCAWLTRPTPK